MRYPVSILLILLAAISTAWGKDYYVAVDGCDGNVGTKDRPFATLEAARDAIRRLKHDSGLPEEGVTVYIRGGNYIARQTCTFDERDSGTEKNPIIYRAAANESVRLMAGRILDPGAFHPISEPTVLKRLPGESHKKVLQIDLKLQGITDYGVHRQYGHGYPVVPAPLELFFNDEAMRLARYPNQGDIKIGTVIDPGSVRTNKEDKNIRGGVFEYTDDRHERWAGVEDVWLEGTFKEGFDDDIIKVASIDPQTRQVRLAAPHLYGLGSGKEYQKYVAVNLLEELDMPGEWYVNRTTGMLYFWPPADIKTAEIGVSILEDPLISLENVSNLTLQGLTLELSRGMGIYMEQCRNVRIAGCVLRNLGTIAILMGPHSEYEYIPFSRRSGNIPQQPLSPDDIEQRSGSDNEVTSCDIYNTGSGGIWLNGGNRKTLINGNCGVINCRIHDYNRRNKFVKGGVSVDGCGNRVAHNEIYNSDFHGIFALGNEHVYEYNFIHHVARDSDDTSAWYTGRNPSYRGNIIRYNFFHQVGRPDRSCRGVYFDDAGCGFTVYGNIFSKIGRENAVYSNAGQDNVVKNNIFIDCSAPVVCLRSMFYTCDAEDRAFLFAYYRTQLELVNYRNPPYSTRYPELLDWLEPIDKEGKELVGMRPRRNRMENNVIYRCKKTLDLQGPYAQFDDTNNFATSTDPGFIDADRLNFQLREDSVVYQKILDFKPIPFEKIGLFKNEFRSTLESKKGVDRQ